MYSRPLLWRFPPFDQLNFRDFYQTFIYNYVLLLLKSGCLLALLACLSLLPCEQKVKLLWRHLEQVVLSHSAFPITCFPRIHQGPLRSCRIRAERIKPRFSWHLAIAEFSFSFNTGCPRRCNGSLTKLLMEFCSNLIPISIDKIAPSAVSGHDLAYCKQ